MASYILDGVGKTFDASDADAARKKAADLLSELGIDSGTLSGPSGQRWMLAYEGFLQGLSGWTYRTESDTVPKKVYRSLPHPRNALSDEDWTGVYELDDGRFLMADVSEDYNTEDFSVLGAVYYNIYDDDGEVDGGWLGYDESGTWEDFVGFVRSGNGPRIVRCIKRGADDGFYDVVDMLEEGAEPDEIFEECGVRPRSASRKPAGTVRRMKKQNSPGQRSARGCSELSVHRSGSVRATKGKNSPGSPGGKIPGKSRTSPVKARR